MRHGNTLWTEGQDATLRAMWAEGNSASIIAGQLGCTRNAVLGRAWRLKLPSHVLSLRKTKTDRARRVPAPAIKRGHIKGAEVRPAKKLGVAALFPTEPPIPPSEYDVARVSFDKLEPHHCKWVCTPTAVGPFEPQFCGCKKVPGQPYCAEHVRRAFSVPTGIPSPNFVGARSRFTGALLKRMTNSVNLMEEA